MAAQAKVTLETRQDVRKTLGKGKFTVREAQERLEVKSAQTVRKHVERLIAAGVLEQVGTRRTGERGRPAPEYRVTANPRRPKADAQDAPTE